MIDLKEIIKSSEKVNVEVKAAQGGIPNSVWETYSSFANTFGGTIILGIGEDKETKKFIPMGVWLRKLSTSKTRNQEYILGQYCVIVEKNEKGFFRI